MRRARKSGLLRRAWAISALAALTYAACSWAIGSASQSGTVLRLTVKGMINPGTAMYIVRGIEKAEDENFQALIIEMNTPGGLDASMREIITKMLASRVPVVVYVSPSGARAASAGAIISLAANVVAMAPATNIGAAHPVEATGKPVSEKITNDAAAFAKSIAKRRGRDVRWAEMVVRKSISDTETEAKAKGIADIIAPDIESLLRQLDGRKIQVANRTVVLRTRLARIVDAGMNSRERFLFVLADPNIAYILMLVAVYGIIAELNNPGAIFPGVLGGISLILAFYALSILPTNTAGLLLILLALALFITDLFVPSHGALTVGGIGAFALGSFILFQRGSAGASLSLSVLFAGVLVTSAFFVVLIGTGIRSLRNPVVTGAEGLVGKVGVARTDIAPEGKFFVDGAYWNARVEGDHLRAGEKGAVVMVDGFTLVVRKPED